MPRRTRGLRIALATALLCAPAPSLFGATLDVTSFGAVPNDGNNDAPAINAAVAAAAPGDTVLIPAGTFDVRSAVTVGKSNLTLRGESRDASIVRYSGTTSGISLVSLSNAANVSLSDFTLDGASSNRPSQGLTASNSTALHIDNIAVRNFATTSGFAPHGVYFSSNVTNSVIANSTFNNIGTGSNWGAGIRLSHGSSNNRVLHNTITNTGRGGILVNDDSTDLLIKHNTVTGSGQSSSGLGIEIWGGSHRAIVEDNHIDHWLSTDGSDFLAIRRNTVSDKTGVYKYAGLELVDGRNSVFTDNVVDGGAKIGISISGPAPKEYVLWARNTIRTPSTWGIQIQGETGLASRQYFHENVFEGALRNHPETQFPPQGHGIRVNGDAADIIFDSNTVRGNEGSAIQVVGTNMSDLHFVNNTITGNGLKVMDKSAGLTIPGMTWHANAVSGNGDNAQPVDTGPDGWSPAIPILSDIDVGDTIEFSTALAGASLQHVLWDFGDGLPSTDLNPSHTYGVAGDYRVSMLAWDTTGRATLRQMIVRVNAGDSPEAPEPSTAAGMLATAAILIARRRARPPPTRETRPAS